MPERERERERDPPTHTQEESWDTLTLVDQKDAAGLKVHAIVIHKLFVAEVQREGRRCTSVPYPGRDTSGGGGSLRPSPRHTLT
ncbi:hypothetical protein E2C01_090145 [Portunus trituberculatus]|uniref:Uncharacterized protein n=1 Tax=Portunus trituberculatus TaxID=210409 RepID=A0A5B7JKL9_PORTR|nr:hypothetical protein [Portunus trituberculatus]